MSGRCFRILLVFLALVPGLTACNRAVAPVAEGGIESGAAGIRLVATYDPRFDRIVEGYRIVSITFVNQSPNLIELDAKKDRWVLTTQTGKTVQAVSNLGSTDPKAWNALPSKAQELLEYPRVILRNTTITFDLLVPKSVDLQGFQKIDFFSAGLNQTFTGGSIGDEG